MCVKEFYGYSCGHCSVPTLRPCPLSLSNTHYPPCNLPAERPLFTEEYCHPCSRVLWNAKVLKEEEEHRERHRRGDCECEFVFDAEERERRGIGVVVRGKGKGRESGVPSDHSAGGRGGREFGAPRRGRNDYHSYRHQLDQGETYRDPSCSSTTRHTWTPEAQAAAHQYHGYSTSSTTSMVTSQHNTPRPSYSDHSYPNQEQSFIPTAYQSPPQLLIGQAGAGMRWYKGPTMASPVALTFAQQANANLPDANLALPPLPPLISINSANEYPYLYTTARPGFIRQKAMSEPANKDRQGTEVQTSPGTMTDSEGESDGHAGMSEEGVEKKRELSAPIIVASEMAYKNEETSST